MTETHPILEYSPKLAPPRELTLEESDGHVRVIFAVAPTWIYLFPIVVGVMVGFMKLVGGLFIAVRLRQLMNGFRAVPSDIFAMRRLTIEIVISASVLALFWWIIAAYEWWMYRRWGRVPRVLTASQKGLILSRLGWWRMRERMFPTSEIKAIELRPVKGNLNWKRTVTNLYIHRHKGWRLRFRLSSSDSQLPRRIAQQLTSKLGCPFIEQ